MLVEEGWSDVLRIVGQ